MVPQAVVSQATVALYNSQSEEGHRPLRLQGHRPCLCGATSTSPGLCVLGGWAAIRNTLQRRMRKGT